MRAIGQYSVIFSCVLEESKSYRYLVWCLFANMLLAARCGFILLCVHFCTAAPKLDAIRYDMIVICPYNSVWPV